MKRILIQIIILTLLTITNNTHAGGPFYTYPQTSQTTCYNTAGTVITCANTGQDGELQTGMPWPNPRFTDNSNGTVTDNLTGLIWLKNANCDGIQTLEAALSFVKFLATTKIPACGLTAGSTSGQWRLPSIVELESLVDPSRSNPALPAGHPFSAVLSDPASTCYWSGSTGSTDGGYYGSPSVYAQYVDMYYGYTSSTSWSRSLSCYVWPVRSGQ